MNEAERPTPSQADPFDKTTEHLPRPGDTSLTGPHLSATNHSTTTPVAGYEILGQLGRGGMGVVYKAREVQLNRTVALKMILQNDGGDPKALIRFLAEAEAAAAIDHPNVVRVFAYGDSNGQPYMALEYLSGGSLAGKLKQDGKLPIPEAVSQLIRISRGVAAAHKLGIVHRDLKPANVLLDANGEPKVADFGLARRGPSDLTQTGAVMGTPAYMAPEQAKGESRFAGPAADVWALGAILYECLTGHRPFSGDEAWSVLKKVLSEDPVAPGKHNPEIPKDLELICLKCLAKEAHERYATATELVEDLERFAAGQPVSVRRAPLPERVLRWVKRKPTLAGLYAAGTATVVLFIFGSVIAWLYRDEAKAKAAAFEQREIAENAKSEAEIAKEGETKARSDAESARDRESTAHAATKQAREDIAKQDALRKVDLAHRAVAEDNSLRALRLLKGVEPEYREWEWRYVAQVAQPEVRQLLARGGDMILNVALSKDGRRIYASCPEGVRVWEPHSGKEHPGYKLHRATVRRVALHPDGVRAVSASNDGAIHIWDRETLKTIREFKADAAPEVIQLAISPDGQRLAVGSMTGRITLWNPDTGASDGELTGHQGMVLGLRFHPDGRLFSCSLDQTLRQWDLKTKAEVAGSKPIAHPVTVWALQITPDGKSVWTGDDNGRVYRYELTGSNTLTPKEVIQAHPSRVWTISFTADGSRMLTGSMDKTARVWHLPFPNPKTGSQTPTTPPVHEPSKIIKGHFSDLVDGLFLPDDKHDLVVTCADFTVRVFDARRDLESRTITIPGRSRLVQGAAFTPNGKMVGAIANGRTHLWEAETGNPVAGWPKADALPVSAFAFSPDGAHIAEGSNGKVRVRLMAGGDGLTWQAHSKSIVGCAFTNSGSLATLCIDETLSVWDISNGSLKWTKRTEPKFAKGLDVSPDGKMLVTCGDRNFQLWQVHGLDASNKFDGHTHHVNQVIFSPDGKWLASASSDNTSRIWDRSFRKEIKQLHTRGHYIYSVAFSPDGRRLAEAAGDGAITIYDTRTGQDAIVLKGHTGSVTRVAFSPDGSRLVSSGMDGTLRIWEAPAKIGVRVPAFAEASFDPNRTPQP